MTDGPPRRALPRPLCSALRGLSRLCTLLLAVALTVLVVRALAARSMGDLRPWHRGAPSSEFRARDARAGFTFDDYLATEARVFSELDRYYVDNDRAHERLLRYVRSSPLDPRVWSPHWNRTQELVPTGEPVGGVLMLHGLTDAPYSQRTLAESLRARGFYVLALRLPGHGTTPGGLLRISWRDWDEAVRLAARRLEERTPPGRPTIITGYSTGGALALLQTLRAMRNPGEEGRVPDAVALFSPMVGITAFARASHLHKILSWIPYFEKSRWMSIDPEFDPHKYASFPKNGGAQSWGVARALAAELDRAERDGRMARFPRLLTFQSAVDATVLAEDVVDRLHRRAGAQSELVLFGVNQVGFLQDFERPGMSLDVPALERDPMRPFRLTVVTNESETSLRVVARTTEPRSTGARTTELGLEWPRDVYSLAHISLPFPPDDPWCGQSALGGVAMRGEKQVLTVSPEFLMRLRYNPFFPYLQQRFLDFADSIAHPAPENAP